MDQLSRKYFIMAGFLLCLIASAGLHFLDAIAMLDRVVLGEQFRILRNHHRQPVANDVVIVGIDEVTFSQLREPMALWHPHLGKFFKALAMAKPALVGLDVVLPERSYHFLIPRYDQSLLIGLATLKAQSPVLLGRSVDSNGNFRQIFAPFVSVAGADGLSSVMVCLDDDGVARRFEENLCSTNTPVKTLSGNMALTQGLGQQEWKGMVDYSVGDEFNYIPFMDVLSWYEQGQQEKLEQAFAGKPVLLGVILPFTDRITFPVPLAAWEPEHTKLPGVLLHAQVYRSMQMHGLIQEVPKLLVLALTLAAALFWFGRPGWIKGGIMLIFIPAILALSLLQLWQSHYLPVGSVLLSGLLAYILRAVYEALLQMRERRMLRGTFGSYVSPQILKEIMAGHIKPGLGGERKRLCVLFSDIRNFTTRSERLPPEEVIKLLNGYFTEMTAAIHKHGGTVDKFIGDGLMAFFGAPQRLECPERSALEAAQEMLVRLESYNRTLQEMGLEPVRIGIGIHVGDVIVGHVGSASRNEYTAIGDVVNTASRLEGITKTLGYPVICSALVADAVGHAGGMVDLGEQAIKGHSAIRVYGWNPQLIVELQKTDEMGTALVAVS